MFFDLLTRFTTSCSSSIRHLGYVRETLAMRRRYQRRRSAWQSHLDNTRLFVLAAAERCKNRGKIVIIGSGLLLDVPLDELAAGFKEVVLMDVVCLPEARSRIKSFPNVSFVEHDATGIAEQFYRHKQTGTSLLPEVRNSSFEMYGNPDLVVSLNILSQLWVMPRAYALQALPQLSEAFIDAWCSGIVESHYTTLRSLPCAVCLVADYEFVKRDIEGTAFSRGSTVYNLKFQKPNKHWTWQIGPLGEESLYYSKELNVGAWHLQ